MPSCVVRLDERLCETDLEYFDIRFKIILFFFSFFFFPIWNPRIVQMMSFILPWAREWLLMVDP